MSNSKPHIEITEEPRAKGFRFRYLCEGRSAGSLPGKHSTTENRTFPSVKVHGTGGRDCIIVVSCVTKDDPARPHPHSLVGKDCNKGVCTVRLTKTDTASFPNLGIQCAKRREVTESLNERKNIRVDPFSTGFNFDFNNIDLSVVRLCFQAFLPDKDGKFTRIVRPVISTPIFDRKSVAELGICRMSRAAGSVHGGEEVFLLCDKVSKDDIEIRLFEEDRDHKVMWEARGELGPQDVHRQFAIVFKTPPYREPDIKKPVTVSIQLKRPSDQEVSDPLDFQYTPDDRDPDQLISKRKRKRLLYDDFSNFANPGTGFNDASAFMNGQGNMKDHLKNHIMSKADATIKTENDPFTLAYLHNENSMMPLEGQNTNLNTTAAALGVPDMLGATAAEMIPQEMILEESEAQNMLSNLSSGGNMEAIAGLLQDYAPEGQTEYQISSGDLAQMEKFLSGGGGS